MKRACHIERVGTWNAAEAIDRVVLDAGDRRRRRIVLTGERGTRFLLDLPTSTTLREGDGLALDDGAIVAVTGQAEPLLELAAASPSQLLRLAWHLGNRHTEMQIAGERLRIRRDHVLEKMAEGLGASVTPVEASFDPEPGEHNDHEHDHHEHTHGG
jgi:urease accessory protein